ncbi:MAG: class I SAM-dependent methyltransferase [Flavobacteriales bacterium]
MSASYTFAPAPNPFDDNYRPVMRNPDKWRPTRIIRDARTGTFKTNHKGVYSGSTYIADLQHAQYLPLIAEHITGDMLDCGCGPVPYHELYAERTTSNICMDYSGSVHGLALLDVEVDLNAPGPLPFSDGQFDSVLMSDMIVHITRPANLMNEINRVLKPGGKVVLTSPFIYWMGEYPHEYYHPSEFALRHLAENAGFEVLVLEAYGGQADVFMDVLNKLMATGMLNRFYRLFATIVKATGWPERNRARTKGPFAQGYSMVIRKKA